MKISKEHKIIILIFLLLTLISGVLLYFITFIAYRDSIIDYIPTDTLIYSHINLNRITKKNPAFLSKYLPTEYLNSTDEFAIITPPKQYKNCPIYIMNKDKKKEKPQYIQKDWLFSIFQDKYWAISCNQENLNYLQKKQAKLISKLPMKKLRSYFFNTDIQIYISNLLSNKIPEYISQTPIFTLLTTFSGNTTSKTQLIKIKTSNKTIKIEKQTLKTLNPQFYSPTRISNSPLSLKIESPQITTEFLKLLTIIQKTSQQGLKNTNTLLSDLQIKYALNSSFFSLLEKLFNQAGTIELRTKEEKTQNKKNPLWDLLVNNDITIIFNDKNKKNELLKILETIGNHSGIMKKKLKLEDGSQTTELRTTNQKLKLEDTLLTALNIPAQRIYLPNIKQTFIMTEYRSKLYLSTQATDIANKIRLCQQNNQCSAKIKQNTFIISSPYLPWSKINKLSIIQKGDYLSIWVE